MDSFLSSLKIILHKFSEDKISVEIIKVSKNCHLYNAKWESPKEIAFAWHVHVLTSCIHSMNHCYNLSTSGNKNIYITDCSLVKCYSHAVTDFCNGHMSNSQMEAYHNYFLTSTKVSYACQLGIQSKKASTNVIILYLANNPVTCRKNILQMKEGVSNVEEKKLLQNFVSLAYLESIYSRDLELISQQCEHKGNVLIVGKGMSKDYRILYKKLLDVKNGKTKLPTITFESVIRVSMEEIGGSRKPWLTAKNIVFYSNDESLFASYNDLCKDRWKYSTFTPYSVLDKHVETVYIQKQFWIMRSPHIVDVILEHMSRGQNIVVYSIHETFKSKTT